MRILHFADLHLGVENYSHIDPATGLSSCFGEFLATFDEVAEFALETNIDLLLFCGDAYKSRDPSQTHQREFAKRVGKLAASGIPVFLLIGNHDLPNAIGRATAVEIFDTLTIRNVIVASRPGTYHIETKGGHLQIVALPWLRRSTLLSQEETKNLTPQEINHRLEKTLTEAVTTEVARLDPTTPAILAAHISLANVGPGSERAMAIGQEPVLLQSSVAHPAFSYVALGHIHKGQILSHNPPVVYPGSLQRIDFGDEKDTKGFYSVEINARGKETILNLHPVKARRFLTIKVNISSHDLNPTPTILRAIAQHEREIKDAIVRVQITIPEISDGLVQEQEIRKALREAQYINIAREVEQRQRTRLSSQAAEEMTPLEALKVYLELKKTPPDQAKTLLQYGERLIQDSAAKD